MDVGSEPLSWLPTLSGAADTLSTDSLFWAMVTPSSVTVLVASGVVPDASLSLLASAFVSAWVVAVTVAVAVGCGLLSTGTAVAVGSCVGGRAVLVGTEVVVSWETAVAVGWLVLVGVGVVVGTLVLVGCGTGVFVAVALLPPPAATGVAVGNKAISASAISTTLLSVVISYSL